MSPRLLAPAIVIALLAPAAAVQAFASHETGVRLHGSTGEDVWVAIRFNVTPDNDLTTEGRIRGLVSGDSRLTGGVFVISDGLPFPTSFSIHNRGWVDREIGHVAAGPARVGIGSEGEDSDAFTSHSLHYGGAYRRPNESRTWLAVLRADEAIWWLNASWTRGVHSWDVASGPATLLYGDEMGSGVHAGAYTLLGAASAGGAISYAHHTRRDTIGWFLPDNVATTGTASWRCTENGVDCRSWDGAVMGARALVSKGATDRHLAIDASAEVDHPSAAVGIVELPDDSYLR